jgi:hypothetical protein
MGFDFSKAKKDAAADLVSDKLFLILLGSSGNGKSYAQGTFEGKTLYLYTQGESHGPKSASIAGSSNIIPVCIDRDGDDVLSADDALKRLFEIIEDVDGIKSLGAKAVSIDGATEIEALIRNTNRFKTAVKSSYDEGPVTLAIFRQILNKLKKLQREAGVHICMTCILNVKEYGPNGEIMDSTPSLHGYQVATGLVQQFDDVLTIGRMQSKDKVGYRIQLLAGVQKATADFKTKEIRKTYNFSPRLLGADLPSLGKTLEPNMAELIKLKRGGK